MTEAPAFLIETSNHGAVAGDVLSDALRVFRVTGAALLRGEFTEPWAWEAPPADAVAAMLHPGATRMMILHIVAEGSCWVEADGAGRVELNPGSLVGFPHGQAHRMGAGTGATPVPVAELFPPQPWAEPPMLRHGADGALTRIICVYLYCDELLFNPFLANLPPVLIVRSHEETAGRWLDASLRYLVVEAQDKRPGSGCLVARLTELLFIEILRHHIAELSGQGTGWLAALGDRHLARALAACHSRPAHRWTAHELARQTGLSRSALVERFHRILHTSPMRYLALWRLQLAAQALQSTDKSITAITAEVGYGSEEAFSRAFKRASGQSPALWRRERR